MTRFAIAPSAPAWPGIVLMLGAGALVAVTSLLAKALGLPDGADPGLSPFQISTGRFTFAFCALLLFLLVRPSARPGFAGARWQWHVLRSICGWLGITCMFAAVARMPLAEATAISFLNPLVAMFLAVVMLGERLGPRKLMAAGCGICGAVLILRPGSEALQPSALFALGAALFMGLEVIFVKRLSSSEPALRVLLINNAIGCAISLSVAAFFWMWPSGLQWLLLMALGVIMVTAQSLFIQSMKRGEASFVIPAFYSVLVFAAFYDFVLYGVVPAVMTAAGAALIVCGAVILALRGIRKPAIQTPNPEV